MRKAGNTKGFTLIEMMIATAVAGVVILISMFTLRSAAQAARFNMYHSHYASRLQTALDDVSFYLQETSPTLVTFYSYNRDGLSQTAICFPTARSKTGSYVLTDASGNITSVPQWQAIVVYAYSDGMIRRYMDYSPRSYGSPISVLNIDNTQIHLSDGTTFNLNGKPLNSNQLIVPILDNARRLLAQDTVPIQLTIEAGVVMDYISDQVFVITLDTGILARNHN